MPPLKVSLRRFGLFSSLHECHNAPRQLLPVKAHVEDHGVIPLPLLLRQARNPQVTVGRTLLATTVPSVLAIGRSRSRSISAHDGPQHDRELESGAPSTAHWTRRPHGALPSGELCALLQREH